MPRNPQAEAISQQSPRLEPADCTATNSGTHAGENVPIAGDAGVHSAAQRNAIPEANVRKTVANAVESQSHDDGLIDLVASDLAIADGYNPNRWPPRRWTERRDHYEFLAKAAIAAMRRFESRYPEDPADESQPCPRCERGTVKRRTGDMWWQVQNLRCSWCRGTGRIREAR